MATSLRVKNWERFQHYKTRNPPWIRLYNALLDDYDFARLPDASKWHAAGLWLLASRYDNRIPDNAEWIGQHINAKTKVDLSVLISAGFVERYDDASGVLAYCKQNSTPETEGETETDTENRKEKASLSGGEKESAKRRGSQIPDGWQPKPEHRQQAFQLKVNADTEAEKFRDHAKSTGRICKDWDAAFRNWLRKGAEFLASRPAPGSEASRVRSEQPGRGRTGSSTLTPIGEMSPNGTHQWDGERWRKV